MLAIARTRSWRRLLAVAGADPDRRAGTSTPGFLLERGRFAKVNPPGAKGTQPQGINDRGQIVGKYSNTTGDMTAPGALTRGFLLDRGRYLRLDFPGSVTSQAFDINNRGQVIGIAPSPEDLASPPPTDPAPMGRMA